VTAGTAGPDEPLRADVCVIGAGPAGLSLTVALARAGVRVILIEGGAAAGRTLTDVRLEGEAAYPQSDISQTRGSGLGGTAGLWSYRMSNLDDQPETGERGCRYAPLDPIDFEKRDQVTHSGWPLSRAELDPWYAKAQQAAGLGRYDYSPEGWSGPAAQPLPLDRSLVETQMFQFASARAWTEDAVRTLRAGDGVRILTEANVTELETDPAGLRVIAVHWRRADGSGGRVQARGTVLAAGGIENSRLLLLSDRQVRGGLGNGTDQVGRYWMEHPLVRGGLLVAARATGLGEKLGLYDAHWQDGNKVMAKLSVAPERMRAEGLLSTSALLIPRAEILAGPAFQAYTAIRSPSGRAATLAARTLLGARIVVGATSLLAARKAMAGQPDLDVNGWSARPEAGRYRVFEIVHQTEQSPDPDNRVVLGGDTDRFGRRIPVLRWRWTPADRARITRSRDVYAEAFARANLGQLIQKDWDRGQPRLLGGNHHHLGGTRMSADPSTGVVDADLKVHGLSNLFVAGSSVFPTGGSVNPTLTVVALSLRLAAHVERTLPTLPEPAASPHPNPSAQPTQ
jgi:choline dehydrogenase-like flavoprotein